MGTGNISILQVGNWAKREAELIFADHHLFILLVYCISFPYPESVLSIELVSSLGQWLSIILFILYWAQQGSILGCSLGPTIPLISRRRDWGLHEHSDIFCPIGDSHTNIYTSTTQADPADVIAIYFKHNGFGPAISGSNIYCLSSFCSAVIENALELE